MQRLRINFLSLRHILNKSRAPLKIAASWIVPRPATHTWVLVGKGAARQWVNPSTFLVESWMLARQYHQGNATASVPKSGPLQAPGHDQKKAGACVIVRALIQALFVGSEGGVEIGEENPLQGSACPYCLPRPPTRIIMKLRSTLAPGRRCVLLGHHKPQGSRPARPFVHWEGQNRSCSRSQEAARYRNGGVIFPNFRCFLNVIYPYASARSLSLMSRVQTKLSDALSWALLRTCLILLRGF
jgi:hypothetical protein